MSIFGRPHYTSDVTQFIEQLKAGELDLLPVVTPSSEREAELQFTRAYLNNPFVLISATAPRSPRRLGRGRTAEPERHGPRH